MSNTTLNIEVIAPCSPFLEQRLQRGIQALESRGHKVTPPQPPANWDHGYLNGPDTFRLEVLLNALQNSHNDVVWIARGGYGLTPLLPQLKAKLKTLENPPMIMGFSDVTALHCLLLSQYQQISFHGPLATTLADENDEDIDAVLSWADGTTTETSYLNLTPSPSSRKDTKASGFLWGGNLSILGHLSGTGFLPEIPGILFLEDVGERPYRIDRMLHQLEQANAFDSVNAVVLGHFSGCEEPETGQKQLGSVPNAKEVIENHFARLKIPVVGGLPCGHKAPNHAFPVGGLATVEIADNKATLHISLNAPEV